MAPLAFCGDDVQEQDWCVRVKADVVVDTLGLFCPVPIIKTSEAIRSLDVGGVVEVVSDDPAIESDLPAWCKSNGHSIVGLERDGDVFRYFVKRRG